MKAWRKEHQKPFWSPQRHAELANATALGPRPALRVTGSLRAAANRGAGAGGGSAALLWRSPLRLVVPARCAGLLPVLLPGA